MTRYTSPQFSGPPGWHSMQASPGRIGHCGGAIGGVLVPVIVSHLLVVARVLLVSDITADQCRRRCEQRDTRVVPNGPTPRARAGGDWE